MPKATLIIHRETKCSFLLLRCTREKVLGAMFWRLNLNMFRSFLFCSERNARFFYHLGINAASFPGKGSYRSCLVKTERRARRAGGAERGAEGQSGHLFMGRVAHVEQMVFVWIGEKQVDAVTYAGPLSLASWPLPGVYLCTTAKCAGS